MDGSTGHPALHVQREGSGPPVALLPGLGSTVAEFRAVVPRLVQRYEVLSIDLPGPKEGRPPSRRSGRVSRR